MIRSLLFLVATVIFAPATFAQTSNAKYAAACRDLVGPIPEFSCSQGVPIPITIDQQEVVSYAPATCDRPALLNNGQNSDGQCVPFSRILNLSNDKIQVSVMCRQKKFRSKNSLNYDEIDVIAHNPQTGDTCWFQAIGKQGYPVNGENVPSPTDATNDHFWQRPEAVANDGCGNCHDNDPFMYSPFIGQVWSEVPIDPLGRYKHVAAGFEFKKWPTSVFNIRDNTCLGCHRIGVGSRNNPQNKNQEHIGTCGALTAYMTGQKFPLGANNWARTFPGSHGMPPSLGQSKSSWNTIYAQSINQITSCCDDPMQAMCKLSKIEQ